jgi:membrane fusion protein (multidrug efflux system)
MIERKRVIYWIIVVVVAGSLFWAGFLRKKTEKAPEEKIIPVEVQAVETGSIEQTIEVTGVIRANHVVYVKSKVPGRIESLSLLLPDGKAVPIEEGLEVKKGRQIAVVDHDTYAAEVARAAAVVAAAESTVKIYEVELADAKREMERINKLYESGSTTEQNRDKAATAYHASEAQLEAAKAQLAQARAQLDLAQINLKESNIVSPIDGIITEKHIDRGNLINVGDVIVTIADMKHIKVIVGLAERYKTMVGPGLPARIYVDAYPDKPFSGKVYSVYPALDEKTRTLLVEIRLDNTDLLLKPGMFARVALVTDSKENVVIVPRDVVLGGRIDDEPYVYVVVDETAEKRFVKIGIKQGDRWEALDGLKPFERLVVNGMNYLTDGSKVHIVRMEDIQ